MRHGAQNKLNRFDDLMDEDLAWAWSSSHATLGTQATSLRRYFVDPCIPNSIGVEGWVLSGDRSGKVMPDRHAKCQGSGE